MRELYSDEHYDINELENEYKKNNYSTLPQDLILRYYT